MGILQVFIIHGKALPVKLSGIQLPGIVLLLPEPLRSPAPHDPAKQVGSQRHSGIKQQTLHLRPFIHSVQQKPCTADGNVRAYGIQRRHQQQTHRHPLLPAGNLPEQKPYVPDIISIHKIRPPSPFRSQKSPP